MIFLPLLFGLTGIVGEYMKSFPVVIDTNLTISLVVSLIGLPVLFTYVAKIKRKKKAEEEQKEDSTEDLVYNEQTTHQP